MDNAAGTMVLDGKGAGLGEAEEASLLLKKALDEVRLSRETNAACGVSELYGFPYLPLGSHEVDGSLLTMLPKKLLTKYRMFPVDRFGSVLTVVVEAPLGDDALDEIEVATGCRVLCFVSTAGEIDFAIKKNYIPGVTADAGSKPRPDEDRGERWMISQKRERSGRSPDFLLRIEETKGSRSTAKAYDGAGSASPDPREDSDVVDRERIAHEAGRLEIPPLDLSRFNPAPDVVELVPRRVCSARRVIPIARMGNVLSLAMVDPLDIKARDDVRMVSGMEIRPVLYHGRHFDADLNRFYTHEIDMKCLLRGECAAPVEIETLESLDQNINVDELVEKSGQSSVIRVVNLMLVHAVNERASDIHIEPLKKELRLRYRVDGILCDAAPPPRHMYAAIVSRIKIMSSLDISERRLPQDGRFRVKIHGREVDFRVSCVPTAYGEKVVLRVLDGSVMEHFTLDNLGFHEQGLAEFRRAISNPYGMILLTGPTSSGKSTTLYMALRELNKPGVNIVTIVDPIEYELKGLNQIAVNPKIGLTFAASLRSIMRQDPDILMIGEMRDMETAGIAIKSALTGHLVMSTLHTNDAASAITRLEDMGIEPFLISSSTLLVAAQRLVRRICPKCRREIDAPIEELQAAHGVTFAADENWAFYEGRGCHSCGNTGYRGRLALIETITIDDDIKKLIIRKAPAGEIKAAAMKKGMKTLRMVGMEKVRDGATTLEEVLRLTAPD